MKSWHYIMIFVVVIVVIGVLLWSNAKDVEYDVAAPSTTATVTRTTVTKQGDDTTIQKEINVLTDEDIEMDAADLDDNIDVEIFDDVDSLLDDGAVAN